MTPLALLLVDDDPVVRQMLPNYFDDTEFRVAAVAESCDQALDLMKKVAVDVVLTDIRMPGMDGIGFTRQLRALTGHIPVVGITSFDEDECVVEMLREGASGVVLKSAPRNAILTALREAVAGRAYVSPKLVTRLGRYLRPAAPASTAPQLTNREEDVLAGLLDGLSNTEIADRLGVSLAAVKKHVANLMGKYGVNSRLKLVVAALRD